MREFERLHDEFRKLNTQVWGSSVDLIPSQAAFAKHCGLSYRLVSGYPNHESAKALGAWNEERSMIRRITYVIDKEGVLRHVIDDPGDMERHANEALEAVKGLSS
ncbi:MAG: redoxin domain-containing protein [Chloroflexi bacterium]|nr:redoxin domain-containing protein [Chloroflexota bacterium]